MAQMQKARALLVKGHEVEMLTRAVLSDAELWSCTQCGACERACAVGVEHISRMMQMRQGRVCTEAAPQEVQRVLALYERCGNPLGVPRAARKVPTIGESASAHRAAHHPNAWVRAHARIFIFAGCMASYEEGPRATLQHATSWLVHNGFDVQLSSNETCCGEPLRRLGNEAGFVACMNKNIAMFEAQECDLIVSLCPHCVHALKNDYYNDRGSHSKLRVMHLWDFLAALAAQKVLSIDRSAAPDIGSKSCLHMPCLLGKRPFSQKGLLELARSVHIAPPKGENVARSHCCGGGGGMFFIDTKRALVKQRCAEIMAHHPQRVFSACPFCIDMLSGEMAQPVENVLDILLDCARMR